jgi:transcriptional regulator
LTRKGELGIKVRDGKLSFEPTLLNKNQFLQQEETVRFIDFENKPFSITLDKGSLAFTVCQVPIIYKNGDKNQVEVQYKDGKIEVVSSLTLNHENSQKIFSRSGEIVQVTVCIN